MKKFGETLSGLDSFGEQVALNFRGKNTFQTKRGGFLTLGIYVIVLWQVLELIGDLYNYEDPKISTYETSKIPEGVKSLSEMRQ